MYGYKRFITRDHHVTSSKCHCCFYTSFFIQIFFSHLLITFPLTPTPDPMLDACVCVTERTRETKLFVENARTFNLHSNDWKIKVTSFINAIAFVQQTVKSKAVEATPNKNIIIIFILYVLLNMFCMFVSLLFTIL